MGLVAPERGKGLIFWKSAGCPSKELLGFFPPHRPAPGKDARRGALTVSAARSRRRYLPQARSGLAVASQRGHYSRLASRRDAAGVDRLNDRGKDDSAGCLIQVSHTAYYARSIIDLGKNKLICAYVGIRCIFSSAWFNHGFNFYLTCTNSTCTAVQMYYARST